MSCDVTGQILSVKYFVSVIGFKLLAWIKKAAQIVDKDKQYKTRTMRLAFYSIILQALQSKVPTITPASRDVCSQD